MGVVVEMGGGSAEVCQHSAPPRARAAYGMMAPAPCTVVPRRRGSRLRRTLPRLCLLALALAFCLLLQRHSQEEGHRDRRPHVERGIGPTRAHVQSRLFRSFSGSELFAHASREARRRPICLTELPGAAAATSPTGAWRPETVSLQHYGFDWLRQHHGLHSVYAASSSRLLEDQTDSDWGGLPEVQMQFDVFLDSIVGGKKPRYDYVKMLDRTVQRGGPYAESFHVLGQLILSELRAALVKAGIWHPEDLNWSIWIGAKGSATAMHVDDHSFNMLYVVSGLKRLVLIDDSHPFECEEPEQSPTACWVERDILTEPPPYAREVLLHAGEALVLPPSQWHAVENLEPTIAFGINEDASCSLREYARLTGPYTGFTL